jgi:hypothetical protein
MVNTVSRQDKSILFEDARIVFRNFTGKEGPYNREGDRNFCLLLDEVLADGMARDGWNIKTLKPRDDESVGQPYIQVTVGFKGRPPTIVLITSRGRTELDEESCEAVDWADILSVDLIIRPYEWSVNGKSGIKAYLQSMYVTIYEDQLTLKYADVEEIPSRSGRINE